MPRNARWSNVDRLLGFDRHAQERADRHQWLPEEERALLPRSRNGPIDSAIPPEEVTKVCLRLRHLIQECIPCEMEESRITTPHSRIITPHVIQAAKEAGGQTYKGCVAYCLLVNQHWFKREAVLELWDSGLHKLRAEACGVIGKAIIEGEEDTVYLVHSVLLRRYSHLVRGSVTHPVNVIEKAVDIHAIRVIGSSGYQKCIGYLWRGWLVQDENDPSVFVDYADKDNPNFFVHMDPDRMRTPRNQNAAQLLFSLIYLGLYTISINSVNPSGDLDIGEIFLYIFTLGYVCDEVLKVYKAGHHILGFWNAFNAILYSFLTASLAFRIVGLTFESHSDGRVQYSTLSYNILAFVAPMFWGRLLLYLDTFRFFGAMLVVLKVMMKESVIFFALLIIIIIGFLQAFIGLDITDDNVAGDVAFIVESMTKAILQSPEFDGFESFGHPWGIILYYCFTFVVMVVLLNILIALYNSAYEDVYDNADDEYLALFSQKTMQFVRAPDENVYIAPFNLVEIFIVILFQWSMKKKTYEFINDCVMAVLYSPLLVITAFFETRAAHAIRRNRARGEEDDDVVEEWEQLEHELDFEVDGWSKTCQSVKPNMDDDPAVLEVRKFRVELDAMRSILAEISETLNSATSQDTKIAEDLLSEPIHPVDKVSEEVVEHGKASDEAGVPADPQVADTDVTETPPQPEEEPAEEPAEESVEPVEEPVEPVEEPVAEPVPETETETTPAVDDEEQQPAVETPPAEPQVQETALEEPETVEHPVEDVKGKAPEEVKPEEVKPEEVKPEEAKPEEAKPEEAKSEEAKQVETKFGDFRTEEQEVSKGEDKGKEPEVEHTTPVIDTTVRDAPAEDSSAVGTPTVETPVAETPTEETPTTQTPTEEAPGQQPATGSKKKKNKKKKNKGATQSGPSTES